MTITRRTGLLAAAAIALAACARQQPTAQQESAADDPRPRAYAGIGQAAADFELPKLGGGVARLSDYAGKALILSFGGLWCPDCVLDGPYLSHLARLAERDDRVAFLDIHTRNRFGKWGPNARERSDHAVYDAEESGLALAAYFAETGHSYPVAFDASRTWAREAYKIEWSPTYVIVDRHGVIRRWRTDLFDRASAEAFFAEAAEVSAA
jgi:thiol-disulfide isomerase/thioredoxin